MGFKARKLPHKIDLVNGVEGLALYLNDFRIAGPKPWGGGKILRTWSVSQEDLRSATNEGRGNER